MTPPPHAHSMAAGLMDGDCDLLPQANGLRGLPPQCGGEGEVVGPR